MKGNHRLLRLALFLSLLLVASACVRPTPVPTASPTVLPATTHPPVPTRALTPAAVPSPLLGVAWEDRAPFRSGLIDGEQGVLDDLPGATVYQIDLQIPEDFGVLQGREQVSYTNREQEVLDGVIFQLFPNTAGGATTVSAVSVDGQEVEPIYEYEDSAVWVPLPGALAPGETVLLQLDFAVEIAREMGGNYGLFGYFDQVLVLDEFYPVIPVYDDEGWNAGLLPPNGDVTYFDASFYLVRVTAPAGLTMVAAGVEMEREVEGDSQVVTYAAGPARTFYLAASERFVVVSDTVGQTTVNSYAFADRPEGAQVALEVAMEALQGFGERFGPYPYSEFDVVSTPMQALGIEYPGMTAITLQLYDPEAEVSGLPFPVVLESTVAHEVAHQWFYNAVGNDQVDEPWLDEAVVQYLTGLYYRDRYGPAAEESYRASWYGRWDRVERAEIPIGWPSGAYSEEEYSPIVYGRGPFFLAELEEELGQEAFEAFLREYYRSNLWGIGTAEIFQLLAEAHCGCDLGELFEQWVGEGPPLPVIDDPAGLAGLPFEAFVDASYRLLLLRDPQYVVEAGLAGRYGLEGAALTDISDAYSRQTQQLQIQILDLLRQYDRESLSPAQQVSYDVYEWYLDDLIRGHEFMYCDYPVTHFLTGIQVQLFQFFTEIHPVTNREDAEAYIARLSQVDTKFDQLIDALRLREEQGIVLPRFLVPWVRGDVSAMARSQAALTPYYTAFAERLAQVPDLSASEREELLEAAEEAIEQAVLPAYRDLDDYLDHLESVAPTEVGLWPYPQGEACYAYLLRHYTTTELTADEIHALGLRELERIHAEMRALFDQLGYPEGESLAQLYNRVALDGGSVSGDQAAEMYEALLDEAGQNLEEAFALRPQAELIVIPGAYGASYYRSASLDGTRPGAFFADTSSVNEPLFAMPTLAYHEGIPGHHFQIALGQESDLPLFRNDVGFSGYAEGWALYAERLAWELGWYEDDPYGDLGRLQAEAFRAARLVVDTGIHAFQWTYDQSVQFMRENTGLPRQQLEWEVSRYVAWPGQAAGYMVGMLRILELRQQAMDALGEQFDLREFHDVLLGNGSMPLEVLEDVVQGYIESNR